MLSTLLGCVNDPEQMKQLFNAFLPPLCQELEARLVKTEFKSVKFLAKEL